MDKFKTFADPATGANPFLPSAPHNQSLFDPVKFVKTTIAVITWPLRLFLFLIALILLPLNRTRPLGCRLLLAACGVWKIKFKNWSFSKEIKKSKTAVVFCNLTSFVEVLALEHVLSPTYALAHQNGTLSILRFREMLFFTFQHQVKAGKGTLSNLANAADYISNKHIGPLVVFPEMQKSNGRVILQWPKELSTNFNFARKGGCYAVTTSYYIPDGKSDKGFTLPHTVGTIYKHAWSIALTPYNYMKLEIIPKETIAETAKSESPVNEVRKLMAESLGKDCTVVSIDSSRLAEFAKYYEKTIKS